MNRLSRFTISADSQIVAGSEQSRSTSGPTSARSAATPAARSTSAPTAASTSPRATTPTRSRHGFNPTDERPGRQNWDAQRTSANTNNPNGKILRIMPDARRRSARPASGRRTTSRRATCSRPGTAQTLPEIYAMGFRNPFRIHVDPMTGWVLHGRLRPGRRLDEPDPRPAGLGRVQHRQGARLLRLALLRPRERPVPRHHLHGRRTARAPTTASTTAPRRSTTRRTTPACTNLPPAKPATMWMGYTEPDTRFPDLGGGGAPTGGTAYRYDEDSDSTTKFPRVLRRPVVHRRVEQRLDQDRDARTTTASPPA